MSESNRTTPALSRHLCLHHWQKYFPSPFSCYILYYTCAKQIHFPLLSCHHTGEKLNLPSLFSCRQFVFPSPFTVSHTRKKQSIFIHPLHVIIHHVRQNKVLPSPFTFINGRNNILLLHAVIYH